MRLGLAAKGALVGGLGILLVSAPRADAAAGYSYFVVGNPADVVTPTSGLLVLQGGGTDVDENFVRMGARSGGGDFVVIRASGSDGYNPYILRPVRLRLGGRRSSSRTARRPSSVRASTRSATRRRCSSPGATSRST